MTTGIQVNGVDLANIFGAKGTHTAAATGIKSNGTDLNALLLALADGQASTVTTGIKVNGADLNTIFGVPVTSLPINGDTFVGNLTQAGNIYTSTLDFNVSTSGWSVSGKTTTSGSLPSGATSVQVTTTLTAGTGTVASISKTTLSGTTLTASLIASRASSAPNTGAACTFVVVFYNSSNTAISTTTFYGSSQV